MGKENGHHDAHYSPQANGGMTAFIPLPQVAQILGISRQRIYQLVKQRHLPTMRINGVLHLAQEELQLLSRERAASPSSPGRKRTAPHITGLPRASSGLLRQVSLALQHFILSPTNQDLFRAALHPRLPLATAHWALSEQVRGFLGEAVALLRQDNVNSTDISEDEAQRIHALIRQACGDTHRTQRSGDTVHAATVGSPGGTSRCVLAHHATIHFLTYGQGLHLPQSILILGRWGTGKARLGVQLAMQVALEVGRPLLYVTTDSSTQNAVSLLKSVIEPGQADNAITIILGHQLPEDVTALPVLVLCAPGNFSFTAQHLHAIAVACKPAAVVIDTLDGLAGIDRVGLDQLVKALQGTETMTVLIAEEYEQAHRETIREQAMSVCDMVLRTRMALPGGAEAMENGLTKYAVEFLRSRRQRIADGRHLLLPQEHLAIYPALDCWGVPALAALPLRAAPTHSATHLPGFSIPEATPHLAALDAALANQWMPGGSLALHGGGRTCKDLLSLYSCAQAVHHGYSCLLLNLRAEYFPMLQSWMREMPRYDCFRVLGQVPCVAFDPASFGLMPALHIWDINPCMMEPEQLLWQISRVLAGNERHPHRCALIAWLHFSELLTLPRFRKAQDFAVYAMRMLAAFGVSSVLNLDAENYQLLLQQTHIPDVLPLTDVQFNLCRLETTDGETTIDLRFRSAHFQLVQQHTPAIRHLTALRVAPAQHPG